VTLQMGEARTCETSEETTQCNKYNADACHLSNILRPTFKRISHKFMFCTEEEIKSHGRNDYTEIDMQGKVNHEGPEGE